MKRNILAGFTLVCCVLLMAFDVSRAFAGDDYVATVSSTSPAVACSSALMTKRRYALQCNGTAYAHVASTGLLADGGAPDPATTNDVSVSSGSLYDFATTGTQSYVCVLASAGTVACKVYLNRGTSE